MNLLREESVRATVGAARAIPTRFNVGGTRLGSLGRHAYPVLLFVPAQALILIAMHAFAPRFFWFDDAATQFGPIWWWLGRTAHNGRPALMDPDLGSGGAYTIDIQYGVLDPFHWLIQAAVSPFNDFAAMSWVVAAICTVLVGTGIVAISRHLGAGVWLSLAAGVGAANAGFLLWFGSTWWPMLLSAGWLVWFWFGMSTRSAGGAVIAGVSLGGLLGSGNPYAFPFALVVILAQLVERRRDYGSWHLTFKSADVVGRVIACAGGMLIGAPTLLVLAQSSAYSQRPVASGILGNDGFAVPNLVDVLLGGPTLTGELNAWGGAVGAVTAMSTAVFAVPALALIDWRRALRSRNVITALALVLTSALLTQLPATMLGLRIPMRYMVVTQIALVVLVVAGLRGARRITRVRLIASGVIVLAQFGLEVVRSPTLLGYHVVALVGVVIAATALVVLIHGRTRTLAVALAGLVLVAGTGGTWFLQDRAMSHLETVADRTGQGSTTFRPSPIRILFNIQPASATTESYRVRSVARDQTLTVLNWITQPDRGWADGVLSGSANLFAALKPGFGSVSVGQRYYNSHVCRDYVGTLCGNPGSLLAVEPTTGLNWLELTSSNDILLAADAPSSIRAYLQANWSLVSQEGTWLHFVRVDGLPGRVTWERNVQFGATFHSGPAYSGQAMDEYSVTTTSGPGQVVLRIPFWPGIEASLNGRSIAVTPLDSALVSVRLPAHVTGERLQISYRPIGVELFLPLEIAGAVLAVLAAALVTRRRYERLLRAVVRVDGAVSNRWPSGRLLFVQLVRFLWSACIGLALDLGVFSVLTGLGVAPVLANLISSAAAVILLYVLVTRYTFRREGSARSFGLFVGWYALSILVFSVLIGGGVTALGLNPILSKVLSLPLSFSANFLFSRYLFHRRDRSRAAAESAQ